MFHTKKWYFVVPVHSESAFFESELRAVFGLIRVPGSTESSHGRLFWRADLSLIHANIAVNHGNPMLRCPYVCSTRACALFAPQVASVPVFSKRSWGSHSGRPPSKMTCLTWSTIFWRADLAATSMPGAVVVQTQALGPRMCVPHKKVVLCCACSQRERIF